ncbi:cyclopropane-fatty-acyl-phospholipid synthase family protein [Thiomicrospira sp. ALE5]|uniref:SAM-dependent methyltransferase n=1 Tax=Thiomicrospira sp. ALE5 TaxID=748650 RepID=UPI0008F405EA|nr:cyclopropane-fatty-acyl-phospholipid synthase family protein [Thiomicrospira sp. ALE5]SFR62803.1 cyclopropane-fatty-acyl-phospholipid synthase [Thiomicrospira sp. ALE5]
MLTKTSSSNIAALKTPLFGSWVLKRLPFDAIMFGSLTVQIGGYQQRYEGQHEGLHAEIRILKPLKFFWLLATQGELGFAKAYSKHYIETPNLHHLLHFGAMNEQALSQVLLGKNWFYSHYLKKHLANHNSIENSKDNISAHYDLGNDFYRLWLDDTMTYSSALFKTPDEDLATAQHNKYHRILDELDVKPNQQILEIGCGWGGFAEEAAKRDAEVTGITLSREQLDFAKNRMKQLNLDHKTQLSLTDYRHQQGQFDHIVSIEMFEAVGQEYWDSYFSQLKALLAVEGKAVLQIITIDEAYAEKYQQGVDFIQTYIFPGGLLPSKTQLVELADRYGFKITNNFSFGLDYAETLHRWRQEFDKKIDEVEKLGFDDKFQRVWHYYLDYCRVGFETQRTDVIQLTLEHK